MDSKEEKELSETDICDLFITPAIRNAGWDPMRQIRREVTLTPGPIVVRGNLSSRNSAQSKVGFNSGGADKNAPQTLTDAVSTAPG